MRIGSLFSGIGGIELGFEQAGDFETIWCIERELYAQAILRKHFPTAEIYDDVTTINFKELPRVDILTGGFPCQDISNAGKRIGITGSRSSLWKYYLKAISEIRPRIALIENVSALLNRGLDVVLCDLAQIGYAAEWHCISASSIGAPHRRDRVFIIAYPYSDGFSTKGHEQTSRQGGISEEWKATIDGERKERIHEVIKSSTDVENTIINRHDEGWSQDSSKENNERRNSSEVRTFATDNSCDASSHVSDTNNERLEGKYEEESGSRKSKTSSRWRGQWSVEPDVGRVADGVSCRVDRIKCLGNAVVPTVAKAIAEAIKEEVKK